MISRMVKMEANRYNIYDNINFGDDVLKTYLFLCRLIGSYE